MLSSFAGLEPAAWLQDHELLLWWLSAFSVFLFIATLLLVPMVVVRIPADYFAYARRNPGVVWLQRPTPLHLILVIGKNLLGMALVMVGIMLLFLPGQGLFTMFVGFLLMNFPGKYRLERWLVSLPTVLPTINRIRTWRGHEPLLVLQQEDQ